MVFLHFFGLGDALRRFELEQLTGLVVAGFRPLALDDLLVWSDRVAQQQHWDVDPLQRTVMASWLDRAEQIRLWQHQLSDGPEQLEVVAALGSHGDWQRHWDTMLRLS